MSLILKLCSLGSLKCFPVFNHSRSIWSGMNRWACLRELQQGWKIKWNLSSKSRVESIKKPLPPSIWPQFDFQLQIMKSLAFIWIFSLSGLLANHLPHEHWRKRHETMMQLETTGTDGVSSRFWCFKKFKTHEIRNFDIFGQKNSSNWRKICTT